MFCVIYFSFALRAAELILPKTAFFVAFNRPGSQLLFSCDVSFTNLATNGCNLPHDMWMHVSCTPNTWCAQI